MSPEPPDTVAGSLTTEDEQLIQALRNLWPILSPHGRRQAIHTVNTVKGQR